ncbi:hypothetical protein JW988_02260 [Candidatus Bathyarchaeota archaeon]|nr:hypothetical protein [Candidatus Bathyarchaeota archaeon]
MLRRNGNSRESEEVSELKIDKDCFPDEDWIPFYVNVITKTCSDFSVTVNSISVCESKKKGLHFYIRIKPAINSELANMLQWLLGDDSRRVDFNRARVKSGLKEWNKLFEVRENVLRTIYEKGEMLQ